MDRATLEGLKTEDLERIAAVIASILDDRANAPALGSLEPKTGREVVERRRGTSGRWLQAEMVRCGKTRCKKCAEGKGHGPYWYLYYTNPKTGRYTSKYIGKMIPDDLAREFPAKAEQEAYAGVEGTRA